MRHAWTAAGCVALALGVVGVLLPLLPTTPFVILAAFLFARGSPVLRARLVAHPRFGPAIRDWEERGAISRRAKAISCALMAAALAGSWLAGFSATVLTAQAAAMAGAAAFTLSRPN